MKWLIAIPAVVVLVTASLGQSVETSLILGPIDIQAPEHIQILVEIPKGSTVDAKKFQLLEDAQPTIVGQAAKPFRDSGWTAAAVLAVDASGSLRRDVDKLTQSLPDFVTQFKDPLAVITFADDVVSLAAFDSPKEQTIAALSQIKIGGRRTQLYSALDKGLNLLETRASPRERQRMVVLSDGAEDSRERPDYIDEVIARASKRRVAIDTIWIGSADSWTRNTLVRLSERTGGLHSDAKSTDQIQAALSQVTKRIDESVVVSFDRKLASSGVTREVGIRLENAGSASMPLAVTKSDQSVAVVEPQTSSWLEILQFLWQVLTVRSMLVIAAVAAAGAAYYFFVYRKPVEKKTPIKLDLPPIRPKEVTPEPSPRVTRIHRDVTQNPLRLDFVKGPLQGRQVAVDGTSFWIGADPDNNLSIDSDNFLSGKHALIQISPDGWTVMDRESKNGTYLDGQRLPIGKAQTLRHGQSIQMGASEIRVVMEGRTNAAKVGPKSEPPR